MIQKTNYKVGKGWVKWFLLFYLFTLLPVNMSAQPQRRRTQQQQQQAAAGQKNGNNAITTRAQISFPTQAAMSEDVVWRRDIYREIDLTQGDNAALYYPVEPVGSQMNLFTYMFKLMMRGSIKAYEYRLDGNEVFTDSARIKPLAFLDNYHIFYERTGKGIHLDDSDIPSREVTAYYIKESAYYDQATSTFHTKVLALCPIMAREDDFGDGAAKYPLFWVKYTDLEPYLSRQSVAASSLNDAAMMTLEDYFTMNSYKGKIYKAGNRMSQAAARPQFGDFNPANADEAAKREQAKIEKELEAFERGVFGHTPQRDSLDSIAKIQPDDQKVSKKKSKRSRTRAVKQKKSKSSSNGGSSSSARITVRRQRH